MGFEGYSKIAVQSPDDAIVLIGGGGHCRSVADTIGRSGRFGEVLVTDPDLPVGATVGPARVAGGDEVLGELRERGVRFAFLGVGAAVPAAVRSRIRRDAVELGFEFPAIIDPSAVVSVSARIGQGAFVGKRAVVNAFAEIGDMAVVNTGAIVEHDCSVGAFSLLSAGAVLCGGASVGDGVSVGANAVVLPGVAVPSGCVVPAGVVVDCESAEALGDGRASFRVPFSETNLQPFD